jgi:hypothetical protein
MERIIEESRNTGKTSKDNPEYKRIHTKISNLRQYFSPNYRYNKTLGAEQVQARKEEILRLEKERAKLASTIPADGFRIYYVRYADDFLVGVNGSFKTAESIRRDIIDFLESKLNLKVNLEKTKITDARDGALFLGAKLKRHVSRTNDQKRRSNSTTADGITVRARNPQGGIIALAPIDRIVRKLADQGICRIRDINKRDVIPTRKTA